MLLYIIPCLYMAEPDAPQCELIDSRCPDLDVKLRDGTKMGRKAVQGILIETAQRVRRSATLTHWAVSADRIVNHQVQYSVVDDELDAITDSMVLRSGMSPNLSGFDARWPLSARGWTPAVTQPRMELVSRECTGHYAGCIDPAGHILECCGVFQVSTVERECVLYNSESDIYTRILTTDMAFTASV